MACRAVRTVRVEQGIVFAICSSVMVVTPCNLLMMTSLSLVRWSWDKVISEYGMRNEDYESTSRIDDSCLTEF